MNNNREYYGKIIKSKKSARTGWYFKSNNALDRFYVMKIHDFVNICIKKVNNEKYYIMFCKNNQIIKNNIEVDLNEYDALFAVDCIKQKGFEFEVIPM